MITFTPANILHGAGTGGEAAGVWHAAGAL